ncbi:MAG: dinitrogenase iron-molybdenum cofactor biosynthesis protein [Desulfatitalea sp.]|nr:hypothetical protein [Desulfatitalea sp.]NNK02391.1 dinitrogenase iron-molybdenum cofactor biosynthesis protein [Desulfatitalea sp.]
MTSIKIAVASTDGETVNTHFGQADRFSIYEMGPRMAHVEDRSCQRLSTGDPQHAFDAGRFKRIADQLKDCSKVYVADIGRRPEAELKALGIEAVRCTCAVHQIGTCGGNCRTPAPKP